MSGLGDPAVTDGATAGRGGTPAAALHSHPHPHRLSAAPAAGLPVRLPCTNAEALAAFATLLAWHAGEDELAVRVRTPGGEGRFSVDFAANRHVRELVARARAVLASPSATGPGDGDATVAAVFAAGLAADAAATAGLALRIPEGGAGDAILSFDGDRFRPEAARRLAGQLRAAVEAMAAAPERRILDIPLLTRDERAERVRWNDTHAALDHGVCLHAAFERHADAAPDRVSILYGDQAITYGELEARANRLAQHLRRRGVGPESRVGICVERGPRVLEAILGVLKAGGAYVPLDATYPPERLAGMVRTAAVRVLVTEEGPGAGLTVEGERVFLDRDAEAIAAESAARPGGGATPENLAYVIFTSGSTGEPKGIALAHRGVMNNLADLNTRHAVGAADRVLLLSSLSFDMSVYETLGILAAGGAVVIPRPMELRDPGAWAGLCRRHGVTLWNSAPALLGMLADHVEAHPEQAPAGLRLAFLGGDWVPVPLVDRVRAWAPRMRDFVVMGGATEASIHSIIFPVDTVDPAWRSIPYGVPMANQRAWVLDAHLREVPVGTAGELFLGGIGLARGYVGRAGFTAERFLPNPHGAPGTRIYRTGDRARQGDDGTIELLGRIDHQVKIRGFRIEPGEIEAALCRHPSVDRAVVVSRAEGGAARLVAYLVAAAAAAPPEARALRDGLRETLPDYMVPAAFVTLDRLPLSPNGKVDRKRLPAAAAERAPYVAPRTPAEVALAEIWAEVLGAERVSAHDDFFALGGHSLSAARVAARVRARLGVQLALGELFRVPTLAELAAALEGAGASADAAPIPRVDGDGPFPLAPVQRRLWLWEQMNPGQAAYNVPVALRLRGTVCAELLERALDDLVRRHPALRTRFAAQGGEPVQHVLPETPSSLRVEDAPPAADVDAWVRRRLAAEGARPFDLATGPLFRALLLRAGEEQVLLLTLHHVVGDGWSVGILLRELAALYDAFSRGEPSPLAPLPLRYADYAAWHRERLARVEAAQLEWWRARLAGAPTVLELPTDRPRPAVQGHRGAQHPVRLAAALVERARALGREEGATLHMVLLAALDAVLARHARAAEVVVGSAAAGRTHPDTEALVGFFVNTLPIRADLSRDPSFRALVRQVRERTLEAYDHQDVPFDRVVEALSPARSRSHAPLVQVAVAFQDAPARGLRLGQARAEAEWVDLGTAQFDLTWLLDEDEHGVAGVLEYATDLFDAATAQRIAGHFRSLLEAAVSAPERRVSALPLVDAAERERVLRAWSGTGEAFPASGALHHRFEAHAAARPGAAALTCDGQSLSYGALNARANRLARRLARLGVGPEARVGVCAGRGPELVAGILAVLKAGGAYVPLDPAYPAERLAYMAEDAGIRVLLAEAGVAESFAPRGVAVVPLGDALAAESGDDLGVDVDPANLAYVIYTSGSTGRPKGVGVTHGNVLRLFASTDAAFGFGADDVWTLFHSYAFDFSVWELWGALLHGGRLVVVPHDVSRDPVRFRELLRGEGVTVLNQTPSAFRALARADERHAEPLERLRTVVFGGEALQYESLRGWLDRYGPRRPRLVNMYGITETTVHVTRHAVTGAELRQGAAGSGVGTPIADLRTYVLDPLGEPAPVGVPGELHVGGAGLARGYLGRPGLTAQRFVPDPFSGEAGARLYRSGDLARWRADGTLEYRGRIDQQVKVRGFRIELGEVESLLLAHPAVSAAAVVVHGEGDEAALAAYVVPAAGAPPSAPELRDALRKHLPEHMVPAAFVALDRIPLTANGKLDRAALPAPGAAAGAPGNDGEVAPRTPVEAVLAASWCEVLRRERVGVTENFFELGGHSLLATRVVARIPELFGVDLSVAELFAAPTVAELATRVEALRQAGRPVPPPIARVDRAGPAPLSFAQERLWFLHRMQPESAFYNVTAVVRLSGALDAAALERALGEVVRRHEPLRTTFREMDGAPVQVVAPFAGFVLPVEALAGPDEAERRVAEEAERPFDLSAGPLFRPVLLRLAAEEHMLLLCMHHIVSDEWSTEVLFRELAAAYAAYRQGGEPHLPELPVRYADFAAWQREHMRGEVLERRLAWWRERLAGAPALLELPTDHPRPAVQSFRGATLGAELPGALRARLEALGRSEGATPYMVLLAAFQVLLARYGGSDDVVVGSPAAGQTRREVQELVGFFTNTLVLRTDLSGDPAFREVLRRVREATLGAYEHQEMPFERLVAELQPERSLSYSPLFQVAFVLADADRSHTELPGLEMRREYAESATSKFDLTLEISESATGLRASVGYSTDLFERGTIARMLAHLERVLEQVAADADVRLSRLELVTADERRTLVEAWNQTERPYPRGVCIHELFAAQVQARPDAEALAWGDARLTYAELDARANRLAHHLARRGVGPESRVGVLLERGVELVVSILAVLKAGGCYVPLDPTYPPERLRLMLGDAGVRVLVTRRALAEPLDAAVGVVALDALDDTLASESPDTPAVSVSPENLAYIVYTSGSTGRPKGVMVAHRHVVQLVRDTDYVQLGPGDRVAQASNASFDALTFEAWGALLNGATLVGIDRDVLLSPPSLRELLRAERITTLYQTTALLNQLSREQPDIFSPLREVLFGGQAADADGVRRILRAGKPRRLLHMYGPTETTAWCSWEQVEQVDDDALTVSIGRPTGNQRIYLLDAALQPVPIGVPGEAYVGGDGVVRGYLDRPGLTGERFVPDPFAPEPGARMYRTGDRLRWKADGTLEFVGRVDDQVKIRGFRIEPGEVESVLCAHPGVREARVVVREDEPGEKRLVGYVVGQASGDELREHLRQSLPEHMVPAAFVALDFLPLTAVGKLDVKSLPAPDLASAEDRHVAPRTPAEEVLAGIWGELLRLERVGAHDDFFALGGHSLLATRVVSRIRTLFGVELPLRTVFERPTVAELAGEVEALRRAGLPVLPPVVPVGRDRPLPLSFAQERLWFLDRMEPGSSTYNIPAALRISGELDVAALERALGEIVRRHEALRTTFTDADGGAVQVIAPFGGFALPAADLSHLPEDAREAEARRRIAGEAVRPFDLAADPLFRASLLRLGHEEHVLILVMHHAVSDGWSLGVLFRELAALYGAFHAGDASPLADLPVQYADYAVWQREQLAGEVLDGQLAWWRRQLAGAPALIELPVDRARPAVQAYEGAEVPVTLPAELVERLRTLGRGEGATLYMVVLAAFQLLLSRHGAGTDLVVGTPVAGRSRGEVEGLIGFFVNTLALRTDLSGDPEFRELLARVRGVTLGAFEHQEVPFEKLVAELHPERSLGHSPIFQVMFSLDASARPPTEMAGVRVEESRLDAPTAKFDLTLALEPHGDGLAGVLNYRTDLFERATTQRLAAHLGRVLAQVAAHPAVRLSAVEMASADERRRILEDWNRAATADPGEPGISRLFEAQAARAPDAVALAGDGEPLTYAALNARANRLAHHLAALGVGVETRVGICLERGAEMVVAMLAVLKAGGAYVPLDPAFPGERLAFMTADSSAAVVVTRESLRGVFARVPVVSVDGDAARIAGAPAEDPAAAAGPGSLAYLIYTSGSTGTPKGVMVEHRGVLRLVRATDYVELGTGDRIAQASTPTFDAATFEIWGALLNGGAVVIVSRDATLLPGDLAAAIRSHGITTLFLTTALFNQVARELPGAFAPLRTLLFGGEAVDPGAVRALLAAGGPGRLLHVYGPTENTTFSSWHPVASVAEGARTVPIGRAVAHSTAYVLSAGGGLVPAGVPGELFLGGHGVARGYLGRPALTAERFVPDPFGGPGARMYRTGDQVRWSDDGALEFLGRLDGQVKIRGFRIEPGEIESVLSAHPAVREARVVVREDVPGDKRLVAYVVGEVEGGALREHLRGRLPEHMLPAAFVALDHLPLNANGKLDVKALPAPRLAAGEGRYLAPHTPTEEVLAEIWAELLQRERVGRTDNFFESGGHSLLATRVVSRVRTLFGVELPLRTLFEQPTIAGVADAVDTLRHGAAPALPPVVPVERDRPLPLTFGQERLWFLDQMQPGNPAYNIAVPLRLSGSLDVAALERAVAEVVQRHEALRTVFGVVHGSPVQRVVPFAGFGLAVTDLAHLPEDEREAEARRYAADDAARPFDLAAGPLFRAALLRLGGREHVLLVAMHHAVSDGWSLGVLFRELWALYEAFARGESPRLLALPVQYADYAAWQRRELAGPVLERQLGWWTERLAGAPVLLELPTDRPRPAVQGFAGGQVPVEVPAGLAGRLRALGREEGATPFMVLLAAFQLLLGKYAGTDDVVVGTPIAGRTTHEVEGVVGFFANTLALRTGLDGDPDFREVLRRVRETTLGAYEHQHVPFEKLVAELRLERSLAHSPLFQVMLALVAAEPRRDDPAGLRVEEAPGGGATTKFDLTLGLVDEGDVFRGSLAYRTDLFDGHTAARMARHLVCLLERVAAEPARPVSALSLLDDEERRLLDAWNDTATPDAADRCIHALFEAQAARTPAAPAVAHRGGTITYRELDERANRLARLLRRRGVGPESRVGVCLERGVEMVVAVLAVLKAGGAYVPLDPAYPAQRLAFMARDAEMEVLVTQASLRGALPAAGAVSVLAVDEAAGELAAESPEPPGGGAVPGNLCYVIYTSGSTGRPKGVGVGHREAASYLAWAGRLYPTHGSVVHSPLSFDLTVTSLFVPLLNGGCVELVDDEAGVEALARRLEGGGTVGMLKLTPAHLRVLGERLGGRAGAGGAACLVVGGEALLGEHLAWWRRHLPESVIVNEYGPTETVVGCCVHVRPLAEVEDGAVPIGRPVANTRLHVLGPAGRRVPVGVPGELYVGGAQVTRGYLGRPALTAARFLPDPHSAEPGARLYRTGDRVRWRADGTLEYLGRLDEQVKVRGFRIEPAEVEAAVRRHPGVADCAVLARPGAGGEARLVAYVAGGFDAEALRAHLRRELPEYMVPALVPVAALPLTPSGKLDHRALPAPVAEAAGGPASEPETEMEARIAALWTELLGVAPGVDDRFFDLGGHSLLLVRMQARLAAEVGHTVPVVELFQFSTVRTLAARLQGNGDTGAVARGEAQGGARQAAADRRLEARRRRNG